MTKGEAFNYIKTEDSRHSSWLPCDMNTKVASHLNDGTYDDGSYKLIYGEVSIGDVIDFLKTHI